VSLPIRELGVALCARLCALAGVPVVKPRHETFYGTAELCVREPGGTTVGFSMRLLGQPAPAAGVDS
jgi:hypothetical protein